MNCAVCGAYVESTIPMRAPWWNQLRPCGHMETNTMEEYAKRRRNANAWDVACGQPIIGLPPWTAEGRIFSGI